MTAGTPIHAALGCNRSPSLSSFSFSTPASLAPRLASVSLPASGGRTDLQDRSRVSRYKFRRNGQSDPGDCESVPFANDCALTPVKKSENHGADDFAPETARIEHPRSAVLGSSLGTSVWRSVLLLAALTPVLPAASEPTLSGPEKLGTVQFAVSGDAETQAHVIRGVKLLHHMMYPEADREFAAVLAHDPDCGFGYWGRAMAIIHPLWPDIPDTQDLQRGLGFVQAGATRTLHSPRERAYLGTMEAFFRAGPERSLPDRFKAADAAWSETVAQSPDDLDATAFGALYRLAQARFLPKDKSHRLQVETVTVLDGITARIPDHPGALHYKIHALDFPLLAGRALEVCDAYGEVAPEVPHALHMPTHIFTRLGQWDKSIDFNERSAASARTIARGDHSLNSHLPHALDYLAYAYLQCGLYGKVEAIARELGDASGPYQTANRPAMAFAFASVPARFALERQDWSAASHLPLHEPAAFPWGEKYVYCDAIVRFARALGAVRSGDRDAARLELAELEAIGRRIAAVIPGSYWAAQANVQVLTIRGWLAQAESRADEALTAMHQAVEIEASVDKEAVTPGEVVPAGELLGELLNEQHRPREALAAFEAQLALSPNRFNGLYGAAHSAEIAGDPAVAGRHFRELLAVAHSADPGNPRVDEARAFLAEHPGT
jgi:tetratricopeptide (TPR) repeat protein